MRKFLVCGLLFLFALYSSEGMPLSSSSSARSSSKASSTSRKGIRAQLDGLMRQGGGKAANADPRAQLEALMRQYGGKAANADPKAQLEALMQQYGGKAANADPRAQLEALMRQVAGKGKSVAAASAVDHNALYKVLNIVGGVPKDRGDVVRHAVRRLAEKRGIFKAGAALVEFVIDLIRNGMSAPDVTAVVRANPEFSKATDSQDLLKQFQLRGIPGEIIGAATDVQLPEEVEEEKASSATRRRPKFKRVRRDSIRLEPIHETIEGPLQDIFPHEERFLPESVEPEVPGTTKIESHVIAGAVFRSHFDVPTRIDQIPGRMSVLAPHLEVGITVYLTPSDVIPQVECMVGPGLGTMTAGVRVWCQQLYGWVIRLAPQLVQTHPSFTIRAVLKKELNCNTLRIPGWPGQTIVDHESLWGRFPDARGLALPADAEMLLTEWSRASLLQSRPVSNSFKDYIIKQYYATDPQAYAYLLANPLQCRADLLILAEAQRLGQRKLQVFWPPSFSLDQAFVAMGPICLGLYPPATQVEWNKLNGARHRIMCDRHMAFVVID